MRTFQSGTTIEDLFANDEHKCLAGLRHLKQLIIGSDRQKISALNKDLGILRRLSHLLEEGNDDVKIEAAVILGSIAKGSKQCVIELISENFVAKLLKSLDHQNLLLVEACLRCLRTIYATDIAPVQFLYETPATIQTLLSIINRSSCTQESVAQILSRSCLNEIQQNALRQAGAVDALAPSLASGITRIQLPTLSCYAFLCLRNPESSISVLKCNFDGVSLLNYFLGFLNRDRSMELQVASAKCLTNLCRAGVIDSRDPIITLKVMPTLVRGCREDIVINNALEVRSEAADTLAYLTEESVELQELTADNTVEI